MKCLFCKLNKKPYAQRKLTYGFQIVHICKKCFDSLPRFKLDDWDKKDFIVIGDKNIHTKN